MFLPLESYNASFYGNKRQVIALSTRPNCVTMRYDTMTNIHFLIDSLGPTGANDA